MNLAFIFCIIFCIIFSIIIFNYRENLYRRDELIEFLLSIGTNKIHHNGEKTLYDHLLSTYDIIMEENGDETIALVAGLHAVYGTTLFKNKTINNEDNRVAIQFGSEIDRLIKLFSTTNRSLIHDSSQEISKNDLYVLQWVEYANFKDQDLLYKIPNIIKKIK
jgi:hypothetical protein